MNSSRSSHTGLFSHLNAWLLSTGGNRYDKLTAKRKRKLFSNLKGRVLEIGAGSGVNLPYYPEGTVLTCLEPNPFMQNYLKEKAQKSGKPVEIITGKAEDIPLDDASVNAVVSTLVLCSVMDMQQVLSEIKRVLVAGGVFLYMEHVAAPEDTLLYTIQRWIKPLWKRVADGCNPDRKTGLAIEEAGFTDVNMDYFRLPLPVVAPQIIGRAVKK